MKLTEQKLRKIIRERLDIYKKDLGIIGRDDTNESTHNVIAGSIPDDYPYDKFAQDVASIIKDEYGSHNIKPFLKAITKYLK